MLWLCLLSFKDFFRVLTLQQVDQVTVARVLNVFESKVDASVSGKSRKYFLCQYSQSGGFYKTLPTFEVSNMFNQSQNHCQGWIIKIFLSKYFWSAWNFWYFWRSWSGCWDFREKANIFTIGFYVLSTGLLFCTTSRLHFSFSVKTLIILFAQPSCWNPLRFAFQQVYLI